MAENIIRFDDNFHVTNVRPTVAYLAELVEFRGFENVVLDFTGTTVAFAEAMVPLVAYCRRLNDEGIKITIKPPTFEKLQRLFLNSNWMHLVNPKKYPKAEEQIRGNIPAIVFTDPEAQHRVVNMALDAILRVNTHLARDHLRALEWSINEITDNVLMHSESHLGAVFELNVRPNSKEIEFIVSDAGVGVPASLRSGQYRDKYFSDRTALEEAVKEGVTRDPAIGQGNGLFGSFQIAALSGGSFHINSGNAYLAMIRDGRSMVRDEADDLRGTSIACILSYETSFVLERALKIAGRPFQVADVLETRYESDSEGVARFLLKDETPSVGSRVAGYEVRNKLQNILRMGGFDTIAVNFSGIGIMSSSFADEVFAKLCVSLGSAKFWGCVRFEAIQDINRQIIERSINQRLRQTHGLG